MDNGTEHNFCDKEKNAAYWADIFGTLDSIAYRDADAEDKAAEKRKTVKITFGADDSEQPSSVTQKAAMVEETQGEEEVHRGDEVREGEREIVRAVHIYYIF